ncbi:MAG: efflux RND transporter periplasmic adaptor subunit [Acidobacteria bacterium]|nr:efflux RND transporter periplasmic adaptor subunit [Acidobacteriota bacterium]
MATVVALGLALAGCGGGSDEGGEGSGRPGGGQRTSGGSASGGPGGQWSGGPGGEETAAVPVEVAAVKRQSVASYIQTNGSLEAENDVQIVARTQGPLVELLTEEGRQVSKGQVMARIDPKETRAQVKIAQVALQEAERVYKRAQETFKEQLISQADYDAALAAKESAEATLLDRQVQLDYTEIRAPFSAVVVDRDVKLGDNVTVGQVLFRISDFDPLLSKIQVPEKELPSLHKGQPAYLTVEAWPGERFPAKVLRLSPVVDATTGTIRVTLEVDGRDKLRPGMFASVFLEVDRHEDALTIPKSALSLESLGDTVYVVDGDTAARRAIQLGYEEADIVEVASGLEDRDRVIVVGQDGLSDGTPIRILEGPGAEVATSPGSPGQRRADAPPAGAPPAPAQARGQQPGGWGGGPPPQMLEACKGKEEGADCSFTPPRSGDDVDGKCQPRRDDPAQLVCRPGTWGGPGGGGSPGPGGGR